MERIPTEWVQPTHSGNNATMPLDRNTLPIWLLAIIATLIVMNIAATLFAPIVFAVVMGVVLSPVSDALDRAGLPQGLSAFLTLAATLFLIATILFLLEPVMTTAINQAPLIWFELRETIENARAALRGLEQAGEQMAGALGAAADGTDETGSVAVPSVTDALLYAPSYAARIMIFVGTLYFFLLSRDGVYRWIESSPLWLTAADMHAAEKQVAKYFLTITMINAAFGVLVSVMLAAFGMPYAVVWGFLATLANFILYLGPPAFAVCLAVAGVVAFDGPISFVPAMVFLGMNMIEGQFVTPSLVGRSMDVNPLLVFLSLVFWLWMWGPVGGIIAIPLLVWMIALKNTQKQAGPVATPPV